MVSTAEGRAQWSGPCRHPGESADEAAASAVTARNAANRAQASANQAARSAATATAAAERAQADARAAYQAKREARASADAAGQDAAAAAQAASQATQLYLQRLKQAELDRRSTAPGSGPNGVGTALDNHKTWGCLSVDASNLSKECLSVFKDFAEALISPAKCNPGNTVTAGCSMVGDLKQLVGENADVLMDMLSFTLMACGLVPGAGEACDAIDAGISFARGDYAGALLSAGSTLPFVGWLGAAGKAWKNSDKFRNVKNLIEKLKKNDSCPIPVPNSFARGTRVLLADGSTKEIEKVHIGDAVMAADPARRLRAPRAVRATVHTTGVKRLVDVAVDEDGRAATAPAVISATPGHPFWVPARRAWVPAGLLAAGMTVRTLDGDEATVASVSVRTEVTSVYNFEVGDLHTYYVMANDEPVLVHNACSKTSGNNPAARSGTAIHGDFSNFMNQMGNGYSGARTLPSGNKIDGAWFDAKAGKDIPIELKPNNYAQIRKGWNQLDKYEQEMGAPTGSGQLWVYDVGPGGQVFYTRVL